MKVLSGSYVRQAMKPSCSHKKTARYWTGASRDPRSHPRGLGSCSCPYAPRRRTARPSKVSEDRRRAAPPLVGRRGASGGCARASCRGPSRPYRRCRSPLPASPAWGHRIPTGTVHAQSWHLGAGRSENRGLFAKFSGSWTVASRNRLQRFLAPFVATSDMRRPRDAKEPGLFAV